MLKSTHTTRTTLDASWVWFNATVAVDRFDSLFHTRTNRLDGLSQKDVAGNDLSFCEVQL